MPPVPQAPPRRRSDVGQVRLQQRDLDGLLLVAERYAAPYDLLAQALGITPARMRAVTARWRAAGYAVTGVLGPGPSWCWLTPMGMAACGHAWPVRRRYGWRGSGRPERAYQEARPCDIADAGAIGRAFSQRPAPPATAWRAMVHLPTRFI
ncbi:MAG: hypothetical protein ACRDOI_18515 [Trebonia sp.]